MKSPASHRSHDPADCEIGALVYRLYGLSEDEVGLVEGGDGIMQKYFR